VERRARCLVIAGRPGLAAGRVYQETTGAPGHSSCSVGLHTSRALALSAHAEPRPAFGPFEGLGDPPKNLASQVGCGRGRHLSSDLIVRGRPDESVEVTWKGRLVPAGFATDRADLGRPALVRVSRPPLLHPRGESAGRALGGRPGAVAGTRSLPALDHRPLRGLVSVADRGGAGALIAGRLLGTTSSQGSRVHRHTKLILELPRMVLEGFDELREGTPNPQPTTALRAAMRRGLLRGPGGPHPFVGIVVEAISSRRGSQVQSAIFQIGRGVRHQAASTCGRGRRMMPVRRGALFGPRERRLFGRRRTPRVSCRRMTLIAVSISGGVPGLLALVLFKGARPLGPGGVWAGDIGGRSSGSPLADFGRVPDGQNSRIRGARWRAR